MPHDTFHEPLPQAATAKRLEHEYISDVSVGRVVGDHARESHLLVLCVNSEAERVLDRAGYNVPRDSLRPVALGQETMDDIQINPFMIGADGKLTFAVVSRLLRFNGLCSSHALPRRMRLSSILNKHLAFGTWHLPFLDGPATTLRGREGWNKDPNPPDKVFQRHLLSWQAHTAKSCASANSFILTQASHWNTLV